jgi:3',5'-cyclic AMP phosphodiesterase CpdA
MKIIHISDIHLTIPGELIKDVDPHQRLRQVFEHVAQNHADADRIVITGDLAHWGEQPAYEALARVIADSPAPVRLMIGNHDVRQTFLDVFPDHVTDESGYVNHAEEIDGRHLIYCDTTMPETHAGHLGPDRLRWIEARLQDAAVGAYIFFHHHPGLVRLKSTDAIGMVAEDRAALLALLRTYRDRIRHLFFGHTHLTISGALAGVPFAGVRSTVHQGLPNFTDSGELLGGILDPYYAVVFAEDDTTVVHQVPFTYDGPVARHGTAWKDWSKESEQDASEAPRQLESLSD